RMFALLDSQSPLPRRFAIAPYFEVAFKERLQEVQPLIVLLQQLDDMLNQEDAN
ncbi:MAG: YqcC family protein, partial [Enterobacterales bacterium]|nr:YqcC family protein [Enterobacterales bacterium]